MSIEAILNEYAYSFILYKIRRLLKRSSATLYSIELLKLQHNFIEALNNEPNRIIRDKLLYDIQRLE